MTDKEFHDLNNYRKIARKLHPTRVGCEMNCSDIF